MTVDTAKFAAITDRVADLDRRLTAYSDALCPAFEAAGKPVPEPLRPGRHAKPRGHLRGIEGGKR